MTKRTLILTDDDDRPWSGMRPPWSRIANPYRYLRSELVRVVCRPRVRRLRRGRLQVPGLGRERAACGRAARPVRARGRRRQHLMSQA